MNNLCLSCREPLDYPSGDGCAAMNKHKDKPMNNYNKTRKSPSYLADKFRNALENLAYDYEDEIVIKSLMEYYDLCSKPNKVDHADEWIEPDNKDLLWAIDRVLQDFMPYLDYREWVKERSDLDEETETVAGRFDEHGFYGENNPPVMSNPGDKDYEV